jgi:hypothetical protein
MNKQNLFEKCLDLLQTIRDDEDDLTTLHEFMTETFFASPDDEDEDDEDADVDYKAKLPEKFHPVIDKLVENIEDRTHTTFLNPDTLEMDIVPRYIVEDVDEDGFDDEDDCYDGDYFDDDDDDDDDEVEGVDEVEDEEDTDDDDADDEDADDEDADDEDADDEEELATSDSYNWDKCIEISPIDQYELFEIMDSFVCQLRRGRDKNRLKQAINGYAPIINFKILINTSKYCEDWDNYRRKMLERYVVENYFDEYIQ